MIRSRRTTRIGATGVASLVGLALVAFAACSSSGPVVETAPGELRGAVVVLIDTLRPDRLSAYGHPRPTSPRIDALAAEGVLFEQTISYSPWTLPSVIAMLAGTPPALAYEGTLNRSLIGAVSQAGFKSAAFTESGYVSRQFGFDLHFAEWHEEQGKPQGGDAGIQRTFRRAKDWIRAHERERFFLLIHTYEPHAPYDRRAFVGDLDPGTVGEIFSIEQLGPLQSGEVTFDDDDLRYLSALYDGGVLESDRHVGDLLDFLDERGLRDETLVVVTSDHGEELGDHYREFAADHGHSLLDDLLRVPLVIVDPTRSFEVPRVTTQVRTMDILPTIAELLGVELEESIEGASLVPLMRGEETDDRVAYGGFVKAGPYRGFVRHLGYKLIEVLDLPPASESPFLQPARFQLYDLEADPGEQNNIAPDRPDLVRQLVKLSRELNAGQAPGQPFEASEGIDEELRERLRSLGYLR